MTREETTDVRDFDGACARASNAHGELSAFMGSVFVMTAGEKEDLKQLLTWHLQQTGDRSAVILRAAMRFIDSVED